MYAWQELTLARVECRLGPNFLTAQRDAARHVLYMIGQPHFPTPSVTIDPATAGASPSVTLLWVIDERHLRVTVHPNGAIDYGACGGASCEGGEAFEPAVLDLDRIIPWLLFGDESPKAA